MTPNQYRREGAEAMRAYIANYCDPAHLPRSDNPTEFHAGYRHAVIGKFTAIRAIDVDEVLVDTRPRRNNCAEGILPCPFCGGPAGITEIDEGENAGGSCVCCTKCFASGNVEFGFKENFISNWNRRVQTVSPDALARLVEAAIAEYLLEPPFQTELERMGRKATARGMMVRLGIYEKFKEALAAMETSHD